MTTPTYATIDPTLPPQTDSLGSAAIVKEAYTVIPGSVMRDIVASLFPEWRDTRGWILNRPVASGATTFAQMIMEVQPGGGSDAPEPQAEVEGFLFVLSGEFGATIDGAQHTLTEGGYAFIPAGTPWSITNTGDAPGQFHWFRKRYEPSPGLTPKVHVGNERDIEPAAMAGTDGKWATTRILDPEDLAYDMHVTVVTFEPGAKIPFLETHVMEHGIYVLEGNAVYRLNDDWVELQAGDYFSLRAFCPQACYAGGPGKFRYLLYKDVNRQIVL
ncbi:(S)-ureidoglycine aminohydrolase [Leucobacter zeae]|nr:(S)-ureidoglycine aminohydrolase [Leucobacter zeae]